ncbi:hypothetical protein PENTCL1PPCAC_13255, partial [Pristionchus entomophagus]
DEKIYSTPQCVICKVFPTTARGYATHLYKYHKSTLGKNGIYLLCACRQEVRNSHRDPNHTKKCDGLQFNLLKLEEKIHSTPQCILCEEYPTTANGFAIHLQMYHNSTLRSNGIYLVCSCGKEVRSYSTDPDHTRKVNEALPTEDRYIRRIVSTPQCVLCETFPTTACEYATHLLVKHKSTLIMNGIYLLCACRQEVRNSHRDPNHTKKVNFVAS